MYFVQEKPCRVSDPVVPGRTQANGFNFNLYILSLQFSIRRNGQIDKFYLCFPIFGNVFLSHKLILLTIRGN